ncbi:MAG: peptide chain release factor 1 [Candidatus Kerfeldbacteria bacterium]|jgi:peptide chain release factor 1
MDNKIKKIKEEHAQIEKDLQSPDILGDANKLSKLSKKYNELNEFLVSYTKLETAKQNITELKKSLDTEKDKEMIELTEEEISNLSKSITKLEDEVNEYINPADPLDKKNIILEIRAGTGGDEAALFAANLYRMYTRYAEERGWKIQAISSNRIGIGGFKEIIVNILGDNVYSKLKYESGTHRVQRVPDTEKSGRVHTSAATVAILPEAEEVDVELKPEELDIQATNSSGAGGQSVNTAYSAIRIVHLPTNTVVVCQDERSQKQNKEKAMQVLRSRILQVRQEKAQKERSNARKIQVGTGDRSEKIRTYNFPQDRVTDHRIKSNYSNIESIMDGNLDPIIDDLKEADK